MAETVAVAAALLGAYLFVPSASGLLGLVVVGYILIERRLRRRSWADLGFRASTFRADVRANWQLIVLEAVVVQIVVGLFARYGWRAFGDHIQSRVSQLTGGKVVVLAVLLVVSTLMEELIYRATLQQRLSTVMHPALAILAAAVVFGLVHRADGPAAVVVVDIALVAVDGALCGWIYQRRHNILVSWMTHFVADVVAALILFS